LRALSFHHANNKSLAPVELGPLLESITGLWKERSASKFDVQRMLAIYEISPKFAHEKGKEVLHTSTPFRLLTAGPCTKIEYVGKRKDVEGPMTIQINERELHESFEAKIYALESAWTEHRYPHLSFLDLDSLDNFPQLACTIGTQTASYKAHVSEKRTQILGLRSTEKVDNDDASNSEGELNAIESPNTLVKRQQSILDRINARNLSSKNHGKPTSQQVLRNHALDKIAEVTEILRMMQQQQKGGFKSKAHDQASHEVNQGNRSGKVSFSLTQIKSNIKSSLTVPIADDEITMCLNILTQELDGTWIKMIERGGASKVVFVVIEGEGMSGQEVKRKLDATK
jgi:DNA replication factor Cdt1 C-terminal domain